MATELPSAEIGALNGNDNKNGGLARGFDDEKSVIRRDLEVGVSSIPSATSASFMPSSKFVKKVGAEMIGTFFLMLAGCGSVVIDKKSNGSITHLGVSLVWGMAVMIMIYAVGHISGAHFNPAVTLAFATTRKFPLINIPGYLGAQVLSAIVAGYVLRLLFGEVGHMAATVPTGSDMQSFFFEILITFLLMFVVSAVATDTKAVGEMAGLAVGTTIAMNVLIAGPISGASMNPARSIGSAVAGNKYTSFWIYMTAPIIGAIAGALAYDLIRLSNRPVHEVTKSGSLLRSLRSKSSSQHNMLRS